MTYIFVMKVTEVGLFHMSEKHVVYTLWKMLMVVNDSLVFLHFTLLVVRTSHYYHRHSGMVVFLVMSFCLSVCLFLML